MRANGGQQSSMRRLLESLSGSSGQGDEKTLSGRTDAITNGTPAVTPCYMSALPVTLALHCNCSPIFSSSVDACQKVSRLPTVQSCMECHICGLWQNVIVWVSGRVLAL